LGADLSPSTIQNWIAQPPDWLEIRSVATRSDAVLEQLGPGEREAICLTEELGDCLIVLDDKEARQVAFSRGLNMIGLLGILNEAAIRGLIDLPVAIERLLQTTFRASSSLIESLLERHRPGRP